MDFFDLPVGAFFVLVVAVGLMLKRIRHGKFRFSLRRLFAVVLVISLPLAWIASCVRDYAREQSVIADLRKDGIDVRTDDFGRWGQSLFLGSRIPQRAFAVYARTTDVTSRHMELVGRLRHVSTLVAHRGNVSDADLVHLDGLRRLRTLALQQCPITGSGLNNIPADAPLRELSLSFCPVDDAGVKNVVRWATMERIELDGTAITDAGLAHLTTLPKLRRLSVSGTAVTGEALQRLVASSTSLENLDLSNTVIPSATIESITKRKVNVRYGSLAPNEEHREAATELAKRGVRVGSTPGSDHCYVIVGTNYSSAEGVADLLGRLVRVGQVTLESPHLTDADMAILDGLTDLAFLIISAPGITDRGLTTLVDQDPPRLRGIQLRNSAATLKGVAALGGIGSLQELYLDGIQVDASNASQLSSLRRLRYIRFANGAIDDETAFELRLALPHTDVRYRTNSASFSPGSREVDLGRLGTPLVEQQVMEQLRQTGAVLDSPNLHGQFQRCYACPVSASSVEQLCKLEALEFLSLRCERSQSQELHPLATLGRLRELSIVTEDFREFDLSWLKQLSNLQALQLHGGHVDTPVHQLPHCAPNLVALDVSSRSPSNEWLAPLANLKALERIRIDGQSGYELDVTALATLPKLRSLTIGFHQFSDSHLESLSALQELDTLHLNNTAVSDAGIEQLSLHRHLRHLNVSHARISPEGMQRLRQALPYTAIEPRQRDGR